MRNIYSTISMKIQIGIIIADNVNINNEIDRTANLFLDTHISNNHIEQNCKSLIDLKNK